MGVAARRGTFETGGPVNKRTFDLIVGVNVGVIGAFTGLRLWSTRYLLEGQPGFLYTVAAITKAVTG